MIQEKWKEIKGFENAYMISSIGRLKRITSKKGATAGAIIKKRFDKNGYVTYSLCSRDKTLSAKAHRLVACAFIGNPYNKPEVNHVNGIKDDNRVENLEWATPSENRKHAWNLGLRSPTKNGLAIVDMTTGEQFKSIREAAKHVNFTPQRLRCQLIGLYENQTNLSLINI